MENNVFVPSTWKRLTARSLDEFFALILYIPFFRYFVALVFTDEPVHIPLGTFFILLFLPALYEFVFLLLIQATPGKWLLGLKVVPQGNPEQELHWTQCVLRVLVERVSLFVSWAIFATAFFRFDRTHVADWVAETRVVQNSPRPQRPKVRWIVAILLIFLCATEGLKGASGMLRAVHWKERYVDARAMYDNKSLSEMKLDIDSELEED